MSSKCPHRERLLQASTTLGGRWRWAWHVRRCAECAEMVRAEEEMTRLFERAGDWEESPEFVEKVRQMLRTVGSDAINCVTTNRRLSQPVSRRRVIAAAFTLMATGIILLLKPFSRRRRHAEGAVFAAMIETLTARRVFHTRGQVTRYDPTTGARQTQVFDRWLKRLDAKGLHWLKRTEIGGVEGSPLVGEELREENFINFPQAVYQFLELKRDGKGVERSRLVDFSDVNVVTERFLLGAPFLTRSAAEALAHHPEAHVVKEPPQAGTPPSRLRVALRDTEGSVLTCVFRLNPGGLLPNRVEVSYTRGGVVRFASAYTVEYPGSVSDDLFAAPSRKQR